jgi:hypothetical protein
MRTLSRLASTAGLCTVVFCTTAQAQTLEDVAETVRRDSAVVELGMDGCVRVHHVWKRQVLAAQRAAGDAAAHETLATEMAYTPFSAFWSGYVGDEAAFARVLARRDLATDPRLLVPFNADLGRMIIDATRREEGYSGLKACADWYVIFGSGVANAGGLYDGTMLLDIFGLSDPDPLREVRTLLPHELNHVSFNRGRAGDPDAGTALSAIIAEGFASWYTDLYWGDELGPADALNYTGEQWAWALAHEADLWALAEPHLYARDRPTIDRFRSARERIRPDAPGKIGYFLGYRIIDAYVQRHGPDSWQALFTMPVRKILGDSGYAPGTQDSASPPGP